MKTNFKFTPVALAIAAFAASPAFAQPENGDGLNVTAYVDAKADLALEANAHLALNTSNTSVNLKKTVNNEMKVKTKGNIDVYGDLSVDSSTMAVVNDSQVSYQNHVMNQESTNSATVSGSVLDNAAGNIGVNVTAGDNNQQANAAAISAADASFVFGSTDAEAFAYQHAEHNHTMNSGQTNTAGASDDVAMNAAGNIGMNFSAGSSNQQKNDLAIATGNSRVATATVSVAQQNDHNMTHNDPVHREEVQIVPVSLALSAGGTYWGGGMGGYNGRTGGSYSGTQSGTTTGTSDQIGNVYPDMWEGSSHPGGSNIGHFDLDTATQGGSDLNGDGGALAFKNDGTYSGSQSGSYSGGESGGLGFAEAGWQALAGTVTGNVPVVVVTNLATTNTASLSGNVLASAAGNIGVNVAAGSNNQQYNGLAIAAIHGGTTNGGGTGGGE